MADDESDEDPWISVHIRDTLSYEQWERLWLAVCDAVDSVVDPGGSMITGVGPGQPGAVIDEQEKEPRPSPT